MAKSKGNPLARKKTESDALWDSFKAKSAADDKGDESLGQMQDSQGGSITLRPWYIDCIDIPPTWMVPESCNDPRSMDVLRAKFAAVKAALKSKSEGMCERAVNAILADLVVGAYQDKLCMYERVLTSNSEGSSEAARRLQQLRQAADTHLLNILKAVVEIRRPPVTVVVKQAEQVNVAGQINQAEKQINVAKNGQPS